MILTNRLFERQAPNREAKCLYIFCEGAVVSIIILNILEKLILVLKLK